MSNLATDEPSKSVHLPKNDKNVIRLLTDELREELKKPQGWLIEGPFETTMERLKELIVDEKPSAIISVGDIVSYQMLNHGLSLDVLIVDNKTMRKPIQPITADVDQTLFAGNPPGAITDEAWAAIKQAVKQKGRTKVIVDGEEDLLTLVTVLSAPEGAFVVYGQPHKGVVVVKVTQENREKMRRIVDSMEESSKS
jgi:GTP-dependent dephospho-CoA kinase